MAEVVAMGELLIDFVSQSVDEMGYPTMAGHPGGAPANFLAALQKYGVSTAMMGKVGGDAFGTMLVKTLADAGIDARGVVVDENVFTTLAFVTLDPTGNRSFSFARKPGADTQLYYDELDMGLVDECRMFHFGTLSLTDEPVRSTTQALVTYAKDHGKLISFDPNLRKPLWRDQETAREEIQWGLRQADIVKISDDEVDFLWGISPKEGAEKLLREFGVRLVFVTLGPEGCLFMNKNGSGTAETPKGIAVKDTTGAGDIFGGSAASGLLKLGKAPEELTPAELREIVTFACCAASLSTTRFGGISSVPEESDVAALTKEITG